MTRNEENKLIAEKCEGLDVKWDEDQGVYVRFSHWLTPFRGSPDPCFVPINDYFTDIAACVRAAEAWANKEEDRFFDFGRGTNMHRYITKGIYHASCWDPEEKNSIWADDPAAALAAALVEAVK